MLVTPQIVTPDMVAPELPTGEVDTWDWFEEMHPAAAGAADADQ